MSEAPPYWRRYTGDWIRYAERRALGDVVARICCRVKAASSVNQEVES